MIENSGKQTKTVNQTERDYGREHDHQVNTRNYQIGVASLGDHSLRGTGLCFVNVPVQF